jgi:hypothetical protein
LDLLTTTVSYSCSHAQVQGGHTKINLYASMNQTMSDDNDEEEDGGCSRVPFVSLTRTFRFILVYNNVNFNCWQLTFASTISTALRVVIRFYDCLQSDQCFCDIPPPLGSISRLCLFACLFYLFVCGISFRFPFDATAAVTPHGTRIGRGRR